MKIAFLSVFYPYRGGIAQFNDNIVEALRQKYEVKTFNFKRQYPNFLFPGKTQLVDGKSQKDIENAVLDSINPISWFLTAEEIKKYQPDLVITSYWMSFFAPSLGVALKQVDAKKISILHNVVPHEKRFFDTVFTRFFLKQNNAFAVMTNAVKEDLLSFQSNAKYVLKQHPLYSHFGNKIEKYKAQQQLKIDSSKKTILFFGLIRAYKGLDILLEAFRVLPNEYNLIIAGESYEDFNAYQKLIDKCDNKSNIYVFNRFIKDEEVPLFYSASEVCVLPYKSATQSGVTAVSFHFNVPVIASNVGGLSETISHQKTGLIIDNMNAEKLKTNIVAFFEDNKHYQDNIEKLKQELSWDSFAIELINLSNSI